jgi:ATP-binding cassette, subfamily B (MDR/TAP), member 1
LYLEPKVDSAITMGIPSQSASAAAINKGHVPEEEPKLVENTSPATSIDAGDEKPALTEEPKPVALSLSDEEQKIIDKQLHSPTLNVGYFTLFRYANRKEWLIMLVSFIASIVAGAVMPLMTLVYGSFAGSFTSFTTNAAEKSAFEHRFNTYTLYYVYLGIAAFVSVYISVIGFSYTGERITQQIRELYLRAIFRQNIAFFDFLGSGEVTTRISSGKRFPHFHQFPTNHEQT